MFEIYKGRKWTYLIPVILFWGVAVVLIYIIIKEFVDKGFTSTTIMGPICTLMVLFFGYMFLAMYRIDPYENLKKWQQDNPALVAYMEADFSISKLLCPHIWRGQYYYFFEGSTNFLVVPIGEVKAFSLKKGYSRSIGSHYDCHVISPYGEAEFAVANILKGSESLLNVANTIAVESNINLDM